MHTWVRSALVVRVHALGRLSPRSRSDVCVKERIHVCGGCCVCMGVFGMYYKKTVFKYLSYKDWILSAEKSGTSISNFDILVSIYRILHFFSESNKLNSFFGQPNQGSYSWLMWSTLIKLLSVCIRWTMLNYYLEQRSRPRYNIQLRHRNKPWNKMIKNQRGRVMAWCVLIRGAPDDTRWTPS